MSQPITASRLLAALNLALWLVLLATRTATPWAELESRRPVLSGTGLSFQVNTAWGLPLFGKELGGCYREGPLVSAFLLANAPSLALASFAYHTLEPSSLPVFAISLVAGALALALSSLQWWALGALLRLRRRPQAVHPLPGPGAG